ncbi:MAG: hypothetical protein ABIG11_09110, partial [bacterium]
SIHQVWQGRFDSAGVKDKGIEVFHFSTPNELREWVKNNPTSAENALYLTDYELLGHQETGLSLVEELNIGAGSILVTSRYEEKQILDNCIRLKVRMIPKGLAGLVPIQIADSVKRIAISKNSYTQENKSDPGPSALTPKLSSLNSAVLIDDDALIHMTWKMSARNKGIALKAFKNPKDFLAIAEDIHKETPVYIDSELGEGLKGENIAKNLHDMGFQNLYMETGHPPEVFAHLTYIKDVIDKEPPWD